MTQPSNPSEMELYKLLQRANLLSYFETFISQGGDDVNQLCAAGEEEFMEIMTLVGMARKPLHVRRLQKALQEWVANPAIFMQQDPSAGINSSTPHARGSILALAKQQQQHQFAAGPANNNSLSGGPVASPLAAGGGNASTGCGGPAAAGPLPTMVNNHGAGGGSNAPGGTTASANHLQSLATPGGGQISVGTPPGAGSLAVAPAPVPASAMSAMTPGSKMALGMTPLAGPAGQVTMGTTGSQQAAVGGQQGGGGQAWSPQSSSTRVASPACLSSAVTGGGGVSGAAPMVTVGLPAISLWNQGDRMDRDSPCDYDAPDLSAPGNFNDSHDAGLGSALPSKSLTEGQIAAIEAAAETLCNTLPHYEPKPINTKKPINREIEATMKMDDDHPDRIKQLRKYAAIYGRFDSKRKSVKPMSLHEIAVNEAAAQICRHRPELLTRRDGLFPLARQVVRGSGFTYTKTGSRPGGAGGRDPSGDPSMDPPTAKRFKGDYEGGNGACEKRLAEIEERLRAIIGKQVDIRAELQRVSGDEVATRQLEEELEQLSQEQTTLYAEQAALHSEQAAMHRSDRYPEKLYHSDEDHLSPSSDECAAVSGSDLAGHLLQHSGASGSHVGAGGGATVGHPYSQNSLIDVGLHIAQRYGMADFATELQTMKTEPSDSPSAPNGGGEGDATSMEGGVPGGPFVASQANGGVGVSPQLGGTGEGAATSICSDLPEDVHIPEGTVVVKPDLVEDQSASL